MKHKLRVIKKFNSYEDAQKDYEKEMFSFSPSERLSIVEILRRRYYLIKNLPLDLKVKKVIKISRLL